MDNLEKRVNDYINNELLNLNNIETNPLEGKDLKDSILNRLFSRKWSRKAQFEDAKKYLTLCQSIMGANWVNLSHFRLGASSVLTNLLNKIKQGY